MAKGVIVVDVPENCTQCSYMYYGRCYASSPAGVCLGREGETCRPKWCYITPLPEEKEVIGGVRDIPPTYKVGFNDCLKEILGR